MATDHHTPDVATRDAQALDAMVEPDLHRGQGYARLSEFGTPVWALIQRMGEPTSQNIARVAWEYQLPEVAVHAAIRYYEQHRPSIDAVIQLNNDWFETLGTRSFRHERRNTKRDPLADLDRSPPQREPAGELRGRV